MTVRDLAQAQRILAEFVTNEHYADSKLIRRALGAWEPAPTVEGERP